MNKRRTSRSEIDMIFDERLRTRLRVSEADNVKLRALLATALEKTRDSEARALDAERRAMHAGRPRTGFGNSEGGGT